MISSVLLALSETLLDGGASHKEWNKQETISVPPLYPVPWKIWSSENTVQKDKLSREWNWVKEIKILEKYAINIKEEELLAYQKMHSSKVWTRPLVCIHQIARRVQPTQDYLAQLHPSQDETIFRCRSKTLDINLKPTAPTSTKTKYVEGAIWQIKIWIMWSTVIMMWSPFPTSTSSIKQTNKATTKANVIKSKRLHWKSTVLTF